MHKLYSRCDSLTLSLSVIRAQSIITDPQEQEIDELFRNRWRTLLSVDDVIADVVAAIDALGELDNTYFISTSDHGSVLLLLLLLLVLCVVSPLILPSFV